MKIFIIGNSGCGKTFLTKKILESKDYSYLHLDEIFWVDRTYKQKRPNAEILSKLDKVFESDDFVIEGVYKSLTPHIIKQIDCLIYLDIPWEECRENLITRKGSEEKLEYAKSYYTERRVSRGNVIYSKGYHDRVYNTFNKKKILIKSRIDLNKSLDRLLEEI